MLILRIGYHNAGGFTCLKAAGLKMWLMFPQTIEKSLKLEETVLLGTLVMYMPFTEHVHIA